MMFFSENVGLQNVYTPLPFELHLVFSVFATVILLIQFCRKKRVCYLFATLAIDATLITHFTFQNRTAILALEIIELALVAGCIIDIAVAYVKKKKKLHNEKEQQKLLECQQKEREKKEEISDRDILDKAFDSELNDLDDNQN